ncbi:MAG: BMC domain-containing protein [Clostridia bacterium]|nr:BMC domain-containing protein [Clostridia bacterium]
MESLGLVEVSSVTGALDALDVMCKTANVSFVTWERKLGGRLVTIIVKGSVAAVTEAVDAAMARGLVKPCAHAVIANPHEETARIVEISASRLKKKG